MSRQPDGDEQLQEWAAQRLDGEIDDQRWEQLLRSHPQTLEQALQEHRRIGDAIRAQARPAADPLLRQAVLARIPWSNPAASLAPVSPRRSRSWHPARWVSAAALAACLLVVLHLEQRSSAANADLGKRVASNSLPQRPPADVIESMHEQDAPLVAASELPRHQEESGSAPSPAPQAADVPPSSSRALGGVQERDEHAVVATTSANQPMLSEPASKAQVALRTAPSPEAAGADDAAAAPPVNPAESARAGQPTPPAPASAPAPGIAVLPLQDAASSPSAPSSAGAPEASSASKDLAMNASPRLSAPDAHGHDLKTTKPVESTGEPSDQDSQGQVASNQERRLTTVKPAAPMFAGSSQTRPEWRVGLRFATTSAPTTVQVRIGHPEGAGTLPAHGLSLLGFDQRGQLVWKQSLEAPAQAQPVDQAHPFLLTVPLVERLQPPGTVVSIALQMPSVRSGPLALPAPDAISPAPAATAPAAGRATAPAP